jgi:hypothetical protein
MKSESEVFESIRKSLERDTAWRYKPSAEKRGYWRKMIDYHLDRMEWMPAEKKNRIKSKINALSSLSTKEKDLPFVYETLISHLTVWALRSGFVVDDKGLYSYVFEDLEEELKIYFSVMNIEDSKQWADLMRNDKKTYRIVELIKCIYTYTEYLEIEHGQNN